ICRTDHILLQSATSTSPSGPFDCGGLVTSRPSMSSLARAVGGRAVCAGQARAGVVAGVVLVPSADPVACDARAEKEGAAVGADPGVEVLPAPFYAHCFGSCRLLNNRLPQCTELVTTFSRSPKRRLDES